MDRLLQMDKDEYLRQMRQEMDRILGLVADAVNAAPDGNVINGSEMQVRDLLSELRKTAYEKAVQLRINSTELNFSPSQGCLGPTQAEEGPREPQHADDQRADQPGADAVVRPGAGQRHAGGSAAGPGRGRGKRGDA
jgi:hypothetical protein